MLASELVERLQKLINEHGDLPVFNFDGSNEIHTAEFYDECFGGCDCKLNEVSWFCEEDHFINGIVLDWGVTI